ncbi:hypothetical protein BAC3_02166 [uncultured bacterium]|nr:hypothetical protein BAC3_02166 [uncultured bacterium]
MDTELIPEKERMTKFSRVIVWYFSGTGNARNAAKWIQEISLSMHMQCELHQIGSPGFSQPTSFPDDALIVLISPIHGFNYPHIMLKFIRQLPTGKNRVILINTRAGMLIGKWVTPGLTGIAFYFASFVLAIKGYSISGMLPIDMPSNWVSLHPGLNDRTVHFIHERMQKKIKTYWLNLLSGSRGIRNFPALKEVVQDLLISPIAILYYFIGRFFIAKTFYATTQCDHCGICIKNCPVHAIKEKEGRPYWTFSCESCMRCMGNCPRSAIETAHGFVLVLVIVLNLLLLYPLHSVYSASHVFFGEVITDWVFKPLLFLSLTLAGYRGFHALYRFRWFQSIAEKTSLTMYRFWGKKYRALRNL